MGKILLKKASELEDFIKVPSGWWILVERTKSKTKLHFFKGEDLYHTCYDCKNDFNQFTQGWKYNEFTHFYNWFRGHGIKHIHNGFKTYANERQYRIFLNKLIQYKKADLRLNLTICIIDEL